MAPGQVQVDGGVGEFGMTEQNLDRAQIGTGFQHVSGETVPERVRRHMLTDPSKFRGLRHGLPDNLLCDGHVGPPVVDGAGEQICLRLHPAPILAQGVQQLRGQQDVAVTATLALANMNDHALAIDIADLEMAWFSASQAGRIQHHQHGAMREVLRGSNEPRHFLLTQYCGHPPLTLGKWNVIGKIRPSECLDEEKTQSSGTTFDGPRREFVVAKQVNLVLANQVNLVLANMFWAEVIGRTVEVLREILYGVDISTDGVLSVVATLKFTQHQISQSSHNNLLVTQNLHH
jgi:hypothetical protein